MGAYDAHVDACMALPVLRYTGPISLALRVMSS